MAYLKRFLLLSKRLQSSITHEDDASDEQEARTKRRPRRLSAALLDLQDHNNQRIQRAFSSILDNLLKEGRGLRAAALIRELQQIIDSEKASLATGGGDDEMSGLGRDGDRDRHRDGDGDWDDGDVYGETEDEEEGSSSWEPH